MTKTEALTPPKTIAMIGLSNKPERPSYIVAQYLINAGFNIIPVNPMVEEILGKKSYPSLEEVPDIENIDVVDVFRKPEAVMAIVEEIIKLGVNPLLWLQEGVVNQEAKTKAEEAGLTVIMDLCMKKEHAALNN
ncbi:MAG: CoA-binding protein [Candidatus Pacebacteria bacterium]|nr:CoA-binding protein [Candidatus Paceibacterota bacterium]